MNDKQAKERGNSHGAPSDAALVIMARAGDRGAFAQLWQRHARSGLRVARQFSTTIDADDLVSEAYVRIYQRVLAGGGPDGAFRPYLYTTIRNLASRWGGDRRDVNVDDISDFEDPMAAEDPATKALDRTLTVRAFRALPERWQSVLWYTEVEGMDPHEVAPILGLTANGVAALSYRAREGLRKAWLQAHVSDATASGECQWAIARLGDLARNGLTARERTRVNDHLATCARCLIISEEVDEVGSRLALVLLPLLLGGIAGGGLLARQILPTSATAATLTPALPPVFAATAVAAPTVAAGLTASSIAAPLIGTLAVAIAISGGLAASSAVPTTPTPVSVSSSITQPHLSGATSATTPATFPNTAADAPGSTSDTSTDGLAPAAGSAALGSAALGSAVLGSTVKNSVTDVGTVLGTVLGSTVTNLANPANSLIPAIIIGQGASAAQTAPPGAPGVPGVSNALDLTGTGIPGATVSLQAAGVVFATTTVAPGGAWAIHVTALATSTAGLQLNQTAVSVLGIAPDMPLKVLSNSLGVTIEVLAL